MKRVLLGVSVVLCVGMAAFGASKVLTNDSGSSAIGVTVQFSIAVTLTSWDTTVFPDVEPTGRARSFVFSGGTLANGAQFRISWSPSSASITNYAWAPGAPTGTASGAAFPYTQPALTYDQIMAQIAHYPGPEEALYVPAEGEQIWLTDLEGHKDIYDNDSIRINYAPTFDKSRITKIEVYRNGIKMRFLPDLFDVISNGQMKTFDGNPLEHTPKSSHTDHAIFGYEYELRFLDSRGLPVRRLLAAIPSPVSFSARRSVNIGIAYDLLEQLSDAEMVRRLSLLKGMGFEAAQFSVFYYVESPNSNSIVPVYETGTPMTVSWSRTMTNEEVHRLLRLIREAGLESDIRLELWLNAEYKGQHRDAGDRGGIMPLDVEAWFRSYGAVCIDLARIAAAERASVFYAAVELDSMERYAAQWRALAADIRTVFSGQVTLVESTGWFLGAENCNEGRLTDLVGQFWDAFDFIAVDHWPNACLRLETQTDQRFSVVAERFFNQWRRAFDYYRAKYPGKRIEFGEIGTYNVDGVLLNGGDEDMSTSPAYSQDLQEMSDAWAALLIGASALGADGITVWTQSLTTDRTTYTGNHWLNATPAENVVEAAMGGQRSVATQSLAVPPLLGFDWEQLPPLLSYSDTPNVQFSLAYGDRSASEAQYWGQTGCRVEAVRAAIYHDAVVVRVELHKPDSIGAYRYIIAFRSKSGNFHVFLDPSTSAANLALDANGVWTWTGSATGEEFAAGDSTVSAVIRNELFSKYIAPAILLQSTVDLHIDYVTAGRRELFLFPGQARSPTDRSGQDFLVP